MISGMSLKSHRSAGWEIRPHSREDRAGIASVYRDCVNEYPWQLTSQDGSDLLEYALCYTSCIVAEEAQAGIIGFMIFNSETGFVSHICVHPDWRFCGIGSGLHDVGKVLSTRPLQQQIDLRNRLGRAACAAMGWTELPPEDENSGWQIRLISP